MLPKTTVSPIASVPIGLVWDRLGGGPLRRGRAPAFWRRSDSRNIALDCERNLWYDFARGAGGGVLNLVQTVRDCDRPDAVRWLRAEGLISDGGASPEEWRRQARHRTEIERAAVDIKYWRLARIAELERVKAEAFERADDTALAASASELYHLQSDGAAVVALYRAHFQHDPDGAAALVAWGRDDEHHAARITAAVILPLAAAEVGE